MQSQMTEFDQPKAPRMLRMPEVLDRTGMSKSFVEAKVREGKFPKPVSLGARAIGFIESEVDQWLNDLVNESRNALDAQQEYRRFAEIARG